MKKTETESQTEAAWTDKQTDRGRVVLDGGTQ
jgi:hypothetical protein